MEQNSSEAGSPSGEKLRLSLDEVSIFKGTGFYDFARFPRMPS